MFNIIYSEFIKLKKTYIFILVFIGGALIPCMKLIEAIESHYSQIPQIARESFIEAYIENIETMSFQFIYIIIFSLMASYVFSREFTDKTSNILYTYPISRSKIFIGKFITVYILILLVYMVQTLAIYLSLYAIWGQVPSINFIKMEIKVNIYSMLLQLIIILIPILISNVTRNIIFPVMYGVLGSFSSIFTIFNRVYMQAFPFMLPVLPAYNIYLHDPIDFVLVFISAILTFCIFMFLCIYQYNTMEIK